MALNPAEKFRGELALANIFKGIKEGGGFEVLSEPTPVYNCIAWAMQCDDRWVDHLLMAGHWWPGGVTRSCEKQSLIDAFKAVGFEETQGYDVEAGYDKVVLYGVGEEWRHASRLVKTGVEYSKFGEQWDATHGHNKFDNTIYGTPYAIMRRKKGVITPPLKAAKIKVNLANLRLL